MQKYKVNKKNPKGLSSLIKKILFLQAMENNKFDAEQMRKNLQESSQISMEAMRTMVENLNHQMELAMQTNKKMAEIFSAQMDAMTKNNIEMMQKMAALINKQMEKVNTQNKEK